jgi:hypothetical protein
VAGVGGLEVAVGLVERVAGPVARQVGRLWAHVVARQVAARGVLVDVVAQVQHHVEVLLGEVAVGVVVAVLVVLARHERQVQASQRAARVGAGLGAAQPAELAAGAEPVPVGPPRAQPLDLDVDGVGAGGGGQDPAPGDHLGHAGAGGDLPVDRHRPRWSETAAAQRRQGRWRQGQQREGGRSGGRAAACPPWPGTLRGEENGLPTTRIRTRWHNREAEAAPRRTLGGRTGRDGRPGTGGQPSGELGGTGRYTRVRALRARAISRSASRLAIDWRLS